MTAAAHATTATPNAAAGDVVFASLPEATPAFIDDGGTENSRNARARQVRMLDAMFGGLAGWCTFSLPARLDAPVEVRGVVAWLALAAGTPLEAAYVAATRAGWGHHLAELMPDLSLRFTRTASQLGWNDTQIAAQWATLAKLTAVAGRPPEQLHRPAFDAARDALLAAVVAHRGRAPNTWTTPLHGLEATLAALGILDQPGSKRVSDRGRPGHWERLGDRAPQLVATMRRYLTQLTVSMRPASVELVDTALRQLADYLVEHHPGITTVGQIRRTHIEGYKAAVEARPGYRGRRSPVKTTIGRKLSHLRCFFDRIIEWGYDDAPDRNPVFAGDMPIPDRPLPRFLDDPAAAKLLTAARELPSLFDRVCVEVLARTGLRKGEFRALTVDAIVQIGDRDWLHVPVGKLHTDRYIPLHPRVRTLFGQWLVHRADQPGNLMFIEHGRPIPQSRVDAAVQRAAAAAGIGHVTPHQLRHTLATQAINRGMSLEAIAALLGHQSMSMTMTYARISDRTVAEEYFAVTEQVEALYDADRTLPAEAAGPNMQRLHAETTRRMLGNGYCGRPADLGCRYETICETCTFFTTTIEFRDQIQAQHTDAKGHGDTGRETAYLKILDTLDEPAT